MSAIEVHDLTKVFRGRRGDVTAVDGVSFRVEAGTTLGIVGESGSGKSTIARCMLGLTPPDGGEIRVLGQVVDTGRPRALRRLRRHVQIVFQEPQESLDPRLTVAAAVAEPLRIHGVARGAGLAARVDDLLAQVGLDRSLRSRRPHQLSGGQQQRVNIARALALDPQVLVLDEPTSSLDVSVRADVLRLLRSLQADLGLTFVLISHDLQTVRFLCDEAAVMYRGRLVESGPVAEVLARPRHPYTHLLLSAELPVVPGATRSPLPSRVAVDRAAGRDECVFRHRCPRATDACTVQPALGQVGGAQPGTSDGVRVACVHPLVPSIDGERS